MERFARLEQERNELVEKVTQELHLEMNRIFGDKLEREGKVRPGIPNEELAPHIAGKIRQLLSALHSDGNWKDAERQLIEAEMAMRGCASEREGAYSGDIIYMEFSGNDKYGLRYGIDFNDREMLSKEQYESEEDQLRTGWYITLYNVYWNSNRAKMLKIANQIDRAGLPLLPRFQVILKEEGRG